MSLLQSHHLIQRQHFWMLEKSSFRLHQVKDFLRHPPQNAQNNLYGILHIAHTHWSIKADANLVVLCKLSISKQDPLSFSLPLLHLSTAVIPKLWSSPTTTCIRELQPSGLIVGNQLFSSTAYLCHLLLPGPLLLLWVCASKSLHPTQA